MSDPFKIDGPACISFSGGRSSAYMLWRVLDANQGLPSGAVVCFANTGKEDEGTLRFVHECETRWQINVNWIEYRDHPTHKFIQTDHSNADRTGKPFEALIAKKQFLPNAIMRFCTIELKIKPIESLLKHWGWGEYDMLVGIRADEPRRIAKMPHLHKPLALAGVSKQDVAAFWKAQPFDLGNVAGNCDLCFNKGLPELMSLIRAKPERAVWWARMEEKIGARFAKDRPTYAEMKQYTESQHQMFSDEEEAIACFCGD